MLIVSVLNFAKNFGYLHRQLAPGDPWRVFDRRSRGNRALASPRRARRAANSNRCKNGTGPGRSRANSGFECYRDRIFFASCLYRRCRYCSHSMNLARRCRVDQAQRIHQAHQSALLVATGVVDPALRALIHPTFGSGFMERVQAVDSRRHAADVPSRSAAADT